MHIRFKVGIENEVDHPALLDDVVTKARQSPERTLPGNLPRVERVPAVVLGPETGEMQTMRNLTVRGTRLNIIALQQYLRTEPLEPGETERQRANLLSDLQECAAASARERRRFSVKCQPKSKAPARRRA